MQVKVLGAGCAKCNRLYAEAAKAITEAGVEATLSKVEALDDIMDYGVMMTPALVVDEQVMSAGKVVRAHKIAAWLEQAAARD